MQAHGTTSNRRITSGPSAPGGPRTRELLRLSGVVLLELIAAVACFLNGWWLAGLVFALLVVAAVASAWLVGSSLARFALGARNRDGQGSSPSGGAIPKSVRLLETVFGAHGMIGSRRAAKAVPAPTQPSASEQAVDAQVGSMLRLHSAVEERFSELLTPTQRLRVQTAREAERSLTFRWLQEAPGWSNVSLTSDDGTPLVGRIMLVDPASPRWVLLAHGYAGRWHEMILYSRHWAAQGYNLLLIEQRAHGRSGGRWRGLGYLERRDIVGWTRWLTSAEGPATPQASIVLHGHSMGAASCCLASAEPDLPPQVSAVICDSPFASGWEACAHLLGDGGLPEHPTLELMRLFLLAQPDGYDMAKASVLDAVRRPGPPVLFVHGAQDSLVPVATAHRLYEAAARSKGLLVVPGAGHCQACLADPVDYYGEAFSFVERNGR